MADAAVSFLLENLKELLLYHAELIHGAKDQIESLHKELSLMKAFLKDSREKSEEFESVKEVVRQITDVTYKAEDIIDTFVVNAAMQQSRSTVKKLWYASDHASHLHEVGKQIEAIMVQVKVIYDRKIIVSMIGREPSGKHSIEKRHPVFEEAENVVGFHEEADTLITGLTQGPNQLDIVSVVGMGGLGKTTLARKVYVEPVIQYHFYFRAWVYVSQEYSTREVFRGILESLGDVNDQMLNKTTDWLREEVRRRLTNHRYLIVLDDVWTKDAWDQIRMALPKTNLGSRILLTTRNGDVAWHAKLISPPHDLRFLTDDESWELLCKKTFKNEYCPQRLEELGRLIAIKCYGLPLSIVVISGLLLKDRTRECWTRIGNSVSTYVARDPDQCLNVLALSYKHLPDHLKVCFIYFGIFPEDYEIPVWKLLRLWVAEGFVQETGQECLEDLAEEYLEDLIDRNLVLEGKRRANGRIKTCRIHDMLRDLCVKEGAEQKFLQVIKASMLNQHNLPTPNQSFHRRLCIHSSLLNFAKTRPVGQNVRSFLCFLLEDQNVPRQHTLFILESFRLVRVLDLRSINFPKFPNEIVNLIHLRFVVLFGNFKTLPATISSLWNLQTIIIRTTNRELSILADIWKMLQLRHLHTSGISFLNCAHAQTQKNDEDLFVRGNILTITTIAPESCTENILARTPNLRKLGIRGKLIKLMEEKPGGSTLFDILVKLERLENLKLINEVFPLDPSQCTIPGLPQVSKFPPNLKKITLSDTLLGWEHMSTLGLLPNLEVLKLKNYAFKGSHWPALDGGFRLLRVLQIERSDLVRWDASGDHFPSLQNVVFRHCASLEAIPIGLAEVLPLQNLELHWPTRNAAYSAKQILAMKRSMQQNNGVVSTTSAFKLLINPPDIN